MVCRQGLGPSPLGVGEALSERLLAHEGLPASVADIVCGAALSARTHCSTVAIVGFRWLVVVEQGPLRTNYIANRSAEFV